MHVHGEDFRKTTYSVYSIMCAACNRFTCAHLQLLGLREALCLASALQSQQASTVQNSSRKRMQRSHPPVWLHDAVDKWRWGPSCVRLCRMMEQLTIADSEGMLTQCEEGLPYEHSVLQL